MTYAQMRDCSTCGEQRLFEAPACADGHDADCPDLACTGCGEAIFLGLLASRVEAPARSRVAPAA